jgi:hypothetical protein
MVTITKDIALKTGKSHGSVRAARPAQTYRLPAAVVAALKSLAHDNRRSVTGELLIALENHLISSGKWSRDGCVPVPVVAGR